MSSARRFFTAFISILVSLAVAWLIYVLVFHFKVLLTKIMAILITISFVLFAIGLAFKAGLLVFWLLNPKKSAE